MGKKNRDNNGLTLVELIAVIAIMATLTGLLVPQFVKQISSKRETACIENRDAVVNICEKMVYAGVPIDKLTVCVNEIVSTGGATSWAIPDEYEEALRSHWICPEDGSALSLSVSNGIISCECSYHSTRDVVADMVLATGSGDNTADPSFAVPTVPGISPVVPTPSPTLSPAPTVTASVISSSFWPYQNDARWDAAGRYNGSSLWIEAPSGKFAMRNSSGALVYYVLIDKNGKGGVSIHYENCYDPSYYLAGRDSECVIATNGTEYDADSIIDAATKTGGFVEGGYGEGTTVNNGRFRIAGGTIYINENGERFIYFHQGSEYSDLPTASNWASKAQTGDNGKKYKMGNWYIMKPTDEH